MRDVMPRIPGKKVNVKAGQPSKYAGVAGPCALRRPPEFLPIARIGLDVRDHDFFCVEVQTQVSCLLGGLVMHDCPSFERLGEFGTLKKGLPKSPSLLMS